MFVPPIFTEESDSEIRKVISHHPLAFIAYQANGTVDGQHVPMIFDGQNKLIGHVAANNVMTSDLKSGDEVLLVFSGQDSYISPNWYPTKTEHHKQVPTWNYQSVHVRGRLTFLYEAKSALAVVGKLTKYFETRTNGSDGWKIADAPKEYIADMLTKLTAFEVHIKEITAKSKLSQNREQIDHKSVTDQMTKRDRLELAERMRNK